MEGTSTFHNKVVVVLGATGTGKSRLAIDLASHFPIEILNSDSMQVYEGLDILTNKVPIKERKGVPHHLMGTIGIDVNFTCKDFRNLAIPLIYQIWSRNHLPVIVGGTNYYIQALLSTLSLDEWMDTMEQKCSDGSFGYSHNSCGVSGSNNEIATEYDYLKKLDPSLADRFHPNNHRKVKHYLDLYRRYGILPSRLLQGVAFKHWGRANTLRYTCCFLQLDVSPPVLDSIVKQRIEHMLGSGLLEEICDFYKPNADYTRGLNQAIGVREFENFFRYLFGHATFKLREVGDKSNIEDEHEAPTELEHESLTEPQQRVELKLNALIASDNELKILLIEAIQKMKLNTSRLIRRQIRRLHQLESFYGWGIHHIDVTEAFSGEGKVVDRIWSKHVFSCATIVKAVLVEEACLQENQTEIILTDPRDLWTRYVCEFCGGRVLHGAHEWEQHQRGRSHRKRICSLRKKVSQLAQ